MDEINVNSDKRKFFRVEAQEPVFFERVFFTEDKLISSKMVEALSKNLSASGLLFVTDQPPKLSAVILLKIDLRVLPNYDVIKGRIFTVKDQVLAKVVRVEEHEGAYHVGVAFVLKVDQFADDITQLITRVRKRRIIGRLLAVALGFLIILSTIAANLIYLQYRSTYRPDKTVSLSPSSIRIPFEEVYFKSVDGGAQLNGWFVPARDAKQTILFCHGRTGNISGELDRTHFFHKMGFNFFIFDYRGYGRSAGRPSEQGLYQDAQAAYDYLISRKDVNQDQIIVVGESLGGAVAADLALHRQVKALVLESTFVSLIEEARNLYPFLPVDYLMLERYDTLSKIKQVKAPKLIVHGMDDEIVAFRSAERLYQEALEPKELLSFDGGHSEGIYKSSDAYKENLNKFFEENLK